MSGSDLTNKLVAAGLAWLPASLLGEAAGSTVLLQDALPVITAGQAGLGATATNGGQFYGSGSVNDLWFGNKNGTAALTLATGTVNLAAAGNVAVNGTLSFGSGLSIGTYTGNLATPTLAITGSGTAIGFQINTKGTGTVNLHRVDIGDNANGHGVFDGTNSLAVRSNNTYPGGTFHTAAAFIGTFQGTISAPGSTAQFWQFGSTDTADGSGAGNVMHVANFYTITGTKGSRSAEWISFTVSGNTNDAAGNGNYYQALDAVITVDGTFGGTAGNWSGNAFASNLVTVLTANAQYVNDAHGLEVDVACRAGSSVAYKGGITSVLQGGDAVEASVAPSHAFGIGLATDSPSSLGWGIGIEFGGPGSWWPINVTTGIILSANSTPPASGPAIACATGIDFSAVTFSTAFLKSTGFLVDGSGNVTAVSIGNSTTALKISGSGSWTANGSTVLALSNVGPSGAHATVQEWLTIKDASGTTRYIPAF